MNKNIIKVCCSNFSNRALNSTINTIIIHHTVITDLKAIFRAFSDIKLKLSCHYVINKDGTIFQLVNEKYKAWHAGLSYWRGRENINNQSIGIEIVNSGYEEFTKHQINSCTKLCLDIMSRHPIEQRNIIGHSDIAPNRKVDPHYKFDWEYLYRNGIGIYALIEDHDYHIMFDYRNDRGVPFPEVLNIQQSLYKYGYQVPVNSMLDFKTIAAMRAFSRHFRNKNSKIWDMGDQITLDIILRKVK